VAKFAFPELKGLDVEVLVCLREAGRRLMSVLGQEYYHVRAHHGPAGEEELWERLRLSHLHVNSGLEPPKLSEADQTTNVLPSTHFHKLSSKIGKMQGELAKMDRKIRAQGNRSKVRRRRKNRTAKSIGKKKC
jgi:hypothetical protein